MTNADRTITAPEGMQAELDQLVSNVNNRLSSPNGDFNSSEVKARCFIRPSGTEDVVRIYIEAGSDSDIEEIFDGAQSLIKEYLE